MHPILIIQDLQGSVDDLSEDELGCLYKIKFGSIQINLLRNMCIHPILFIQDLEGSVDDLSEDELGCLDEVKFGSIYITL